jgi:DNA-binding NtrC family response regulator
MFKLFKTKQENNKKKLLYIDFEEEYRFIIGEIFKQKADITFASSLEHLESLFSDNYINSIDIAFLCVDQIDHSKIINLIHTKTKSLPPIILISNTLDAIQMYDLVSVYGAIDYIGKPFSKNVISQLYDDALVANDSVYKKRLLNDLDQFNQIIDDFNITFKLNLPCLKLEPLDRQIEKLSLIQKELKANIDFPKSKRPNILFIDDEKNIIDVYQQFVSDKPFNPFFSGSLKESRDVLKEKQIDLIILDLGLPDGHGINLLTEIYKDDPLNTSSPDVIVISSFYEKKTVLDVISAGAKLFINKPMTYKKFISSIYQLTFLRFMRKELKMKVNQIL